mmetsp:Transcript_28541/g.43151  ORF Transcript_28541/g.43151 Transcript_28541/m.43151 type:complete len:146 (+) Transcript_28541:2183-2620(+)
MVSSPHHPSREIEVHQGKNQQLQTLLSTLPSTSGKFVSPLELFYTRFYRFHASFYDLEVLNRTTVKTFAVLLEVPLFKKIIKQVYPPKADSKSDAPKGDASKGDASKGDASKSDPPKDEVIHEKQAILEPLSRKALQRTLADVFT